MALSRKQKVLAAATAGNIVAYVSNKGLFADDALEIRDAIVLPVQDAIQSAYGCVSDGPVLEGLIYAALAGGVIGAATLLKRKKSDVPVRMNHKKTFLSALAGAYILGSAAYAGFTGLFLVNNHRQSNIMDIRLREEDKTFDAVWINRFERLAQCFSQNATRTADESEAIVLRASRNTLSELIGKDASIARVSRAGLLQPFDDFYDPVFGQAIIEDAERSPSTIAHEVAHRYFADEARASAAEYRTLKRAMMDSSDAWITGDFFRRAAYFMRSNSGEIRDVAKVWSIDGKSYRDGWLSQMCQENGLPTVRLESQGTFTEAAFGRDINISVIEDEFSIPATNYISLRIEGEGIIAVLFEKTPNAEYSDGRENPYELMYASVFGREMRREVPEAVRGGTADIYIINGRNMVRRKIRFVPRAVFCDELSVYTSYADTALPDSVRFNRNSVENMGQRDIEQLLTLNPNCELALWQRSIEQIGELRGVDMDFDRYLRDSRGGICAVYKIESAALPSHYKAFRTPMFIQEKLSEAYQVFDFTDIDGLTAYALEFGFAHRDESANGAHSHRFTRPDCEILIEQGADGASYRGKKRFGPNDRDWCGFAGGADSISVLGAKNIFNRALTVEPYRRR